MFDEVFLKVNLQKCYFRFFKREQFTDSAVAINKTKKDFFNCNKTLRTPLIFFHSSNSLALDTVCIKNRLLR